MCILLLRKTKGGMHMSVDRHELLILMGERLKRCRVDRQLTQEQFAELIQMSITYYGRIERGESGLSLEKIYLFSKKFDIDPTYLLTGLSNNKNFEYVRLLERCPKQKRYDLEQLIKYACLLAQ